MILFVGHTFRGHHHDYAMLKAEFPPDSDWFATLKVLVDLGYLGIRTELLLPHKKPRQSQHNPQPTLTADQKAANQAISHVRIAIEHAIEHAIAGIKRYNILVHRFRNRRATFHDDVIALCAGLWNFALIYYGTTLLVDKGLLRRILHYDTINIIDIGHKRAFSMQNLFLMKGMK